MKSMRIPLGSWEHLFLNDGLFNVYMLARSHTMSRSTSMQDRLTSYLVEKFAKRPNEVTRQPPAEYTWNKIYRVQISNTS